MLMKFFDGQKIQCKNKPEYQTSCYFHFKDILLLCTYKFVN